MPWFEASYENWSLEEVVNSIEMSTEQYNVNVVYPEFFLSGRSLKPFNTTNSDKIFSYVENFHAMAEELVLPDGIISELNGTYSTYTAANRFISVKFDLYPYLGGAHPGHDIMTSTFDVAENTVISLSDFFEDNNDYLERLSILVEKALFEKYPELSFAFTNASFRRGFAPDENNFTNWAITDTGLIIFFRTLQIAPFAAGALEVEIPYTAFQT